MIKLRVSKLHVQLAYQQLFAYNNLKSVSIRFGIKGEIKGVEVSTMQDS